MVTSNSATEVLPGGIEAIRIGKRRQRAHYYRRVTVKGGEMVWVRTELLPADIQGRAYYMSKGFRLDPPEGTEWATNKRGIDDSKSALEREVTELRAQLESKLDLEMQLEMVKDQLKRLGVHKGKKGRPVKGG